MKTRTLVFLVLLFACAKTQESSAPTTTSAAAPEPPKQTWGTTGPCSWLTDAEVSEALGQPSKSTVDTENNNCKVDPADKTGTVKLFYRVADNTGAYSFNKAFKDAEDVTGIGDKAVWSGSSLAVVKGTRCLNVVLSPADEKKKPQKSEMKAKALALAQKIVERM